MIGAEASRELLSCHSHRSHPRCRAVLDGRSRRRGALTPRRKDQPAPGPGQLLRRELLGSQAVYRVIGENDRGIEVEVVDVQGLSPGSRFTFRLEEVLAMESLRAESMSERRSNQARGGAYIQRPA